MSQLPVPLANLTERELMLLTLNTVSTNHRTETAQIAALEEKIKEQDQKLQQLQISEVEFQRVRTLVYKDDGRLNRASTIVWTMASVFVGLSTLLAVTYYILKLAGKI